MKVHRKPGRVAPTAAGERHAAGESAALPATLGEAAYQRLRADIVVGAFKAGEPLRLEALRQRYGLSFSPLREALMRLQSERLVAATALRGFSVAPLSREEIEDATETRILIESEALRRSMRNGDDDWEADIEPLSTRSACRSSVSRKRRARWRRPTCSRWKSGIIISTAR